MLYGGGNLKYKWETHEVIDFVCGLKCSEHITRQIVTDKVSPYGREVRYSISSAGDKYKDIYSQHKGFFHDGNVGWVFKEFGCKCVSCGCIFEYEPWDREKETIRREIEDELWRELSSSGHNRSDFTGFEFFCQACSEKINHYFYKGYTAEGSVIQEHILELTKIASGKLAAKSREYYEKNPIDYDAEFKIKKMRRNLNKALTWKKISRLDESQITAIQKIINA